MARIAADEDRLLATIRDVHAAGLDEGGWPAALESITSLIGGVGASLEVMSKPTPQVTAMYAHGLPGADAATYARHYAATCRRTLYGMRQRQGGIIYESQFIDDRGIDTDPFYMEFLARCDMRYFIGGVVVNDTSEHAYLAVQRSPRQGHVNQREIDLHRVLLPHVQQAFEVMRRLSSANHAAQSLSAVLDWLDDATLLLDDEGRVLHLNQAAETVLRGCGVRLKGGVLEFREAATRSAFRKALEAMTRSLRGDLHAHGGDFSVPCGPGSLPYVFSVRPLTFDPSRRPVALLFIKNPAASAMPSITVLRTAFGLTRAEAHLAAALVTGTSLKAYGEAHRVSANTVYTHLRRVKQKCGQSTMVGLLHGLRSAVVPVRPLGP